MSQTTDPLQPAESQPHRAAENPGVIPVIEERVSFSKEVVETANVRIVKRVNERDEVVDMLLNHEEISVDRVAVNQYVETPPPVRYEGDVVIVPVLREVIEKSLLLVEELRVTRNQVKTRSTQTVTLRSEDVQVEREEKARPQQTPD